MVIPLIVGGLNSIKKYKKNIFIRLTNLECDKNDTQHNFNLNFSSRTHSERNLNFFGRLSVTNKFLIICAPELINVSEFKDSIEKLFKNQDLANIVSLTEDNNFVKIVVNINNENNTLCRIDGFIRLISEKSSHINGSTILNDWKITNNVDGKKIQIISSDIYGKKLEINIFIPNKKNTPIKVEYIKPVNHLYKEDLNLFSTLLNPSGLTHKTKNSKNTSHIDKYPKIYSELIELNSIYDNFLGKFEKLSNDHIRSNTTSFNNYKFGEISTNLRNTNFEVNSTEKDLFNEYSDSQTDHSSVISSLEDLGVKVYFNDHKDVTNNDPWNSIGGYEDVKNQIDEHILFHFKHPEILDKITEGTRVKANSNNRPKLILFEGPPGTGKTSSARIIGNVINVPLIYVSLENIVSKWFGESETRLSKIFDFAKKFSEGCIIFIDEVDTMAISRDKTEAVHEGSKKILSVLLRKLDGFDTLDTKTLLICATNRKKDLDNAFINRIDSTVHFPLPNEKERELIFGQYAKHLTYDERAELAKLSGKLSGRSIRHVCLEAEREWASILIKEKNGDHLEKLELPTLKIYKNAIQRRYG
ncbi:CDC48 like AAA ATPase [Cryptosporidium xiaoi]|uniref:CDC48 like AAA ATPase n=1 Tax=Cryptosporidium xiaoi TaxID=659607 RepID=A0AAV9XUH0_9CRYT